MILEDLKKIAKDATDFTYIHIKKTAEDTNHPATILFLHGTQKPHRDLFTYTNSFCEGIIFSEFYKKYNRFPTKEEIRSIDGIIKENMDKLEPIITNYELKGEINIIKL